MWRCGETGTPLLTELELRGDLSARAPQKFLASQLWYGTKSPMRGSNTRPFAYEANATTTELTGTEPLQQG